MRFADTLFLKWSLCSDVPASVHQRSIFPFIQLRWEFAALVTARCFSPSRTWESFNGRLQSERRLTRVNHGGSLFKAGWLVCCHCMLFHGEEWEGRPQRFRQRRGFLASFSFKQIHFVLLQKGNPKIYTIGLSAAQRSRLITKGWKSDLCMNPSNSRTTEVEPEKRILRLTKRCSFAFESVLECSGAIYCREEKTFCLCCIEETRSSADNQSIITHLI